MAVTFVAANAAYQAASRIGAGAPGAAGALGSTPLAADGTSFQHALTDAMKNAMSQMRTGESAAGEGAAGKGDIVQVVNAVTAAELTLETVVAIRDRVISAYQDIMKMPI